MRKLLALCLAFSLSATAQVAVVDQADRTVVVPRPLERVVSLYGVATMYLYALGQQGKLVLGTYVGLKPDSPSWEAFLSLDPALPQKYSRHKPSLEEILAREPDLVVANSAIDREEAAGLEGFGVPVLLLYAEDVAGVKEAISLLGEAFGVPERAGRLRAYFEERVEAIAGLVAERGLARPRTLFVGSRPLRVASGEMYQSAMIELAGGTSVTAGLPGYWQDVNVEQVLLWDPEVIFIAPYGKVYPQDLMGDPVWGAVSAVRGGRVYKMPRVFSPWDVPTPESFLGVLWMAAKLHPELPLDLAEEVRSFYREFYHYQIPDELLAGIAG